MSEEGRRPSDRLRFEEESPEAVTSGQVVPKSKKKPIRPKGRKKAGGKKPPPPGRDAPPVPSKLKKDDDRPKKSTFRQDSEKSRPSERLRHDGGAKSEAKPEKKAARENKRFDKSGRRAEKTGSKLNIAQDKLSAQKPVKKPGPIKSIRRAAQFEAWRYAHGKIHEVEHENVGIEAGHKAELAGEKVVRAGTRFVKKRNRTRPARRVRKWTKRDVKAKADFQFRTMARENPELKQNVISRHFQKQRLKKQYQKKAREAAQKAAKKTGEKTLSATQKVGRAVIGFVKRHHGMALIALGVFLLIVTLQSCMSTFVSVGNTAMGAVVGTSYLAEDADIDRADLAYSEMETDLEIEIANIETTQPGYNEYRYSIGDIGHDPLELMAFLTAVYDDFTYPAIESVLREVFNEQYTLTVTEVVEVRYRTETHTSTSTDPETGETTTDSYEVEVVYDYYILNVTLTADPFYYTVLPRLNSEQYMRFQVYMITRGSRQYSGSPFDFNWIPYVTSYYGYRVHPISGVKDQHMGIDIGLPTGTEIKAGHDGAVTFAANNGAYGLVVVLDNGKGFVTKYAHCDSLLVSAGQTVKAGDVIAKVGNTGNSTGPHLHFEVIKDGSYLNPIFFALSPE